MATAIDQHKRAAGAEVAQVQLVNAHGLGIEEVGARNLDVGLRSDQGRCIDEKVGQVGLARLFDHGRVDRDDRVRERELRTGNARAGHDDHFAGVAVVGALRFGALGQSRAVEEGGAHNRDRDPRAQTRGHRSVVHLFLSLDLQRVIRR